MATDAGTSSTNEKTPPNSEFQTREKVFEQKLLNKVSRTHSVLALLRYYGLDLLVYGSVYIAGQHKVSPLWLIPPVALLVVKDILWEALEKQRFAEVIATLRDDDKDLVLADLSQLPPWVHNPDIERCNWLNMLMLHFWPYVSSSVEDLLETKVRPAIEKIPGLKIQKFSLGSLPPNISGIKVYDEKVSSSHLLLDVNISYSGDCEISVSYLGVPVGVDNFQIHGPARLDFLIIPMTPFFGGVEFSFLSPPRIDFELTGIGSLGLSEEIIRKVINSKVASLLVSPKKVGHVWAKGEEVVIHEPEGVIRVNVIEAKNLENKDISIGILLKGNHSDPYVEVTYGSKSIYSRVIDDDGNPRWDLWCEFVAEGHDKVTIKVFDQDLTSDDLIGTYQLNVADLKKGNLDSWVNLEGSKGSMHVKAYIAQVSSDPKQLVKPPEEFSFLSSFVLSVLVQSGHNLTVPRTLQKPTSIAQLTVGNDTQETKRVEKNDNPVYGEVFHFCVNNPDFNKLKVKVISVDDDDERDIGSFTYSVRKLLDRTNMEILDQHFPLLDSASGSTVVATMKLRVIKNTFF